MKIAVEGCCHGELEMIYSEIARREKTNNYKVDLLLLCGDFQAMRNPVDLQFMACPDKYKRLGEFHKYYTGEKRAPILTLVIGGNHEASNYMWELYHGGWLAPNIYYLGAAGSIKVNGLRISGASGIFKPEHYALGHFERFPYSSSHMRSIYHTRFYDIQKLMFLESPDIFLSHDWPLSIERYGDTGSLLRAKPFFRSEVSKNCLGSPPLLDLLQTIKPARWFAAHMHVRFEAVYPHAPLDSAVVHPQSPDEINLEDMDEDGADLDTSHRHSHGLTSAPLVSNNPDEIILDDDMDDEPFQVSNTGDIIPNATGSRVAPAASNPDEIVLDDDVDREDAKVDESVDVLHGGTGARVAATNPDEIIMVDDEDAEHALGPVVTSVAAAATLAPKNGDVSSTIKTTSFLALDKCLPRRQYLEVIDVPTPVPVGNNEGLHLTFDPLWLGVTRAFFPYLSLDARQPKLPDLGTMRKEVAEHVQWVKENVLEGGECRIGAVQRFKRTAPGGKERPRGGLQWYTNPQTEAFCEMLGLQNVINAPPADVPTTTQRSDGEQAEEQSENIAQDVLAEKAG